MQDGQDGKTPNANVVVAFLRSCMISICKVHDIDHLP